MFDVYAIVAFAMIVGPRDLEYPGHYDVPTCAAVRHIGEQMGVVDPCEEWSFWQHQYNVGACVNCVRSRLCEVQGCPRLEVCGPWLPPAWFAEQLETARAFQDAAYHWRLSSAVQAEAQRRVEIYQVALEVTRDHRYIVERRQELKRLVGLVGLRTVVTGEFPPPVPLELIPLK